MHRMSGSAIPGADDPKMAEKIRAIAKVLGVPEPIDVMKVKKAFDDLIESNAAEHADAGADITTVAASLGLSASEKQALVDTKGDPRRYVELREERRKAKTWR